MRILFSSAYSLIEPLGLLHLAGLARDMGWETKFSLVKDFDFTRLLDDIRDYKPDVIGFNIYTGNHLQTFKVIEEIADRWPGIKIVLGGPHPTYFPLYAMGWADYVVMSEGFASLRKILEGGHPVGIVPYTESHPFPLPDRRQLYSDYPEFAASSIKSIIATTGCPYRCTYCFTGDMLVHTSDGMKKISDVVRIDGEVKVIDAYGSTRIATQFYQRDYNGSLIRINLWKTALDIECTPNHELFTERGKVRSDQIRKDDWLRISVPKIQENHPDVDPRLAGLYVAEGSVCFSGRGSQLRFSFNKNEFDYIEEVGEKLSNQFETVSVRNVTRDSVTHVEVTRKHVCQFFFERFGKGAAGKKIPHEVFGWCRDDKLDFIRGWMDGDGYKKQGRIITVSPTLAIQGFLLSLSVGMRPSLYVRDIPESSIDGRLIRTNNRMWTLAFNLPVDRELVGCEAEEVKGIFPSPIDRFVKFVDGIPYIRVKSASIEHYIGSVYNIGVEDEHSYSVNGFAVSNCYNSSSPDDIGYEMKTGKGERLFPFNQRSPREIAAEVEDLKQWPTEIIYFQDDVHGFDLRWMEEFAAIWSERGIPYHAQMRWEMVNNDGGKRRLDLVREAGCTGLTLAIEAADPVIRAEVLDRATPSHTMHDGMRNIRQCGLKVRTEQITGLPYGATSSPTPINLDADLELVKLNAELRPDMAWASTFAPYAGTKLGKYSQRHGHYNNGDNWDVPDTFFEKSVLRFPREWVGPELDIDSNQWLDGSDLERYRDQNAALRRHFNFFCLHPDGYQLASKFLRDDSNLDLDSLLRLLGGGLAGYVSHIPRGQLVEGRLLRYMEAGAKKDDALSTAVRHHLYEEVLYKV